MKWDKLIIFDIDETLIYASDNPGDGSYDLILSGYSKRYYVWKRPGLDEFLNKCVENFEHIAVWTAADEIFCKEVCNNIIKRKLAFAYSASRCTVKHVAAEDRGLETNRQVIKDLRKVFSDKRFTKAKTLIIDNTPSTYSRNYGNAVPIRSFMGEPDDNEFEVIWKALEKLGTMDTVRGVEKRRHINPDLYT